MASRTSPLEKKYIANDHSNQTTGQQLLQKVLKKEKGAVQKVLDLGCGMGKSVNVFRRANSQVDWVGLDIVDSPQVRKRTIKNGHFCSFDGINIPFQDNSFDLIYSNQVLEHVRYPHELLCEVHRVLKNDGYFVGSTSQFEAYHTYSYWNYTPFGFVTLVEDANMTLEEIRPSIDGITLLLRAALGSPRFFGRWWGVESPVNRLISLYCRVRKRNHRQTNSAKMMLCGQFSFIIRKRVPREP